MILLLISPTHPNSTAWREGNPATLRFGLASLGFLSAPQRGGTEGGGSGGDGGVRPRPRRFPAPPSRPAEGDRVSMAAAAVKSTRRPPSRCWAAEGGNGGGPARPCHPPLLPRRPLRGARRVKREGKGRDDPSKSFWFWLGFFFSPEDPLLPHTQALETACERAQP